MGAQWLSGRVLDSRPKGRGFEPHRCHCVVSLSKNINPSLVLVQPRKTCPYITERLLMGRKESNQTNKTNQPPLEGQPIPITKDELSQTKWQACPSDTVVEMIRVAGDTGATMISDLTPTPGRRQSKTPILSRNVDQKSIETVFLIAICRQTGDKWESKTLFLSIFDLRLSIVDNVFDCRLHGVTPQLFATARSKLTVSNDLLSAFTQGQGWWSGQWQLCQAALAC